MGPTSSFPSIEQLGKPAKSVRTTPPVFGDGTIPRRRSKVDWSTKNIPRLQPACFRYLSQLGPQGGSSGQAREPCIFLHEVRYTRGGGKFFPLFPDGAPRPKTRFSFFSFVQKKHGESFRLSEGQRFPSSMLRNTGSSSPGEELMTLSTSAVAVCCCRRFSWDRPLRLLQFPE